MKMFDVPNLRIQTDRGFVPTHTQKTFNSYTPTKKNLNHTYPLKNKKLNHTYPQKNKKTNHTYPQKNKET